MAAHFCEPPFFSSDFLHENSPFGSLVLSNIATLKSTSYNGSLSIVGVNRKMKMNEVLKTRDSVKLSFVFDN